MKEFIEKFQIESLLIKQIGPWKISLRPKQITVGTLILSLDRKCSSFAKLNKKEGKYLIDAFRFIESLFKRSFNPDKINYLALMMVDNQVHYHVIPRYENSISILNELFYDNKWPLPPELGNVIKLKNEQYFYILNRLKEISEIIK